MATPTGFDWSRCIFCQSNISKCKTNCPANSKRTDVGIGYRTLCETLRGYINLGQLPGDIKPYVQYWDEGDGMESTFIRHSACWHIKCKHRFVHATKLDRLSAGSDTADVADTDPCLSDDTVPTGIKVPRTARSAAGSRSTDISPTCFFCDLPGTDLRQVMTFTVDDRVRKCATLIQDSMLLAKLASGDMIATEAKYHPSCLLDLYYKAGHVKSSDDNDELDETLCDIHGESLALAEVLAYIEGKRVSVDTPAVFKLSDLNKLYCAQLSRYKVSLSTKSHSSRLKERLLANCPHLTCVSHGRDVLLTFQQHIGVALQQVSEHSDSDSDAICLMHAAKLLRRHMLSSSCNFNGSLSDRENTVPPVLLNFFTMLLEGPCEGSHISCEAALSLSQLVKFNAVRHRRHPAADPSSGRVTVRHTVGSETPLPIYIGLMLHSASRKKKYIKKCHKLGLCISYDRVMQITNKTANTLCSEYRSQNVVCPPSMQCNLFTVAAADNIDHNLSSSTAQSSFHGTAISLMQFPNTDGVSISHMQCTCILETASDASSDILLPTSYTEIEPCILPSKDAVIPPKHVSLCYHNEVTDDEYAWLENTRACLESSCVSDNMSWSAFHAECDDRHVNPCASSVLLPLFRHTANSPAMMRHCLTVVQAVVKKVSPSQTPVVTVDQPLYALMKQIQWHWPNGFGEDKFVILLGGLHIEMAILRMLGHWLDGSGWIQCLVQAGIATLGVAQSFITVAHVKRTRYVHTVTAAALFINLRQLYVDYCDSESDDAKLTFGQWKASREESSVQFKYWSTVLELELLLLAFVRSIRQGQFSLYLDCLQKLAGWFFVCDQTNYARWLPVHICDMLALKQNHPNIYSQFVAGNFVVSKSRRKFSSIAIDHAHEQLNAIIKGEGGAVGLTENDAALSRWAVTAPEIARMLQEFECNLLEEQNAEKHCEQTAAVQNRFKRHLSKLLDVFNTEIPFSATSGNELLVLCTNTLADKSVADSVTKAPQMATDQFHSFFEERLKKSESLSILSPIRRNRLPLFNYRMQSKKKTSSSLKLCELKTDCALFGRLYIACQTRDGNLDGFFCHENQPYPPSLSQGGYLRSGTKSELLECFTAFYSTHDLADLVVECCILDGAVAVQMLRPNVSSTFGDYKEKVFLPYLLSLLNKVQRVDVVFDVYYRESLKLQTREKRGVGARTRVTAATKIPANWQEFLRVDYNKTQLFNFFTDLCLTDLMPSGKTVIMTCGDGVRIYGTDITVSDIEPCNQEEADTRIILHCFHAASCGMKKISVRTVDTDIVVLAVSFFSSLNLCELWFHFGVGKNIRLIPVHELSAAIGPRRCAALPAFHALTGCDTVSSLYGKGKKSAWAAWDSCPQLTEALLNLQNVSASTDIDDSIMSVLERYIVILYDRTSDCDSLNAARKQLFTKKSRTLDNLPPTSDAFILHVKRAVYQAVHCWSHCLQKQLPLHDPALWGWCKDEDRWSPVWMTLPEVSDTCRELICCSCKKACTSRCKCVKANLPCTGLCQCDGECTRS